MDWLALDMDDGLLRREPTRKAALKWWMAHNGTDRVLNRYQFKAGAYRYVTARRGDRDDSCGGVFIEREDAARRGGWEVTQSALYPHTDRPHKRVERD